MTDESWVGALKEVPGWKTALKAPRNINQSLRLLSSAAPGAGVTEKYSIRALLKEVEATPTDR